MLKFLFLLWCDLNNIQTNSVFLWNLQFYTRNLHGNRLGATHIWCQVGGVLSLKKNTLTVYSENCVYWINFHAVLFWPRRRVLRLYLLRVLVYLLHSAGVHYACRLLAFCFIIYFQVFWSGSLLLYQQVLPKCFLLFVLKKYFLPRNTFLLRINLSFDFTCFKGIMEPSFSMGTPPFWENLKLCSSFY